MAEDSAMNRRRALALATTLAVGWVSGLVESEIANAAKKDRKAKDKDRKNRDKDKDKKRKKTKKGQSAKGSGYKVGKEAQKHKGAKYKWGGASPKGFDCSGFTWYVFDRAVGMEIGRTVKDQYKKGKAVDRGSWNAGDIVFFKNTFEHGLSHNGIYISGSKFIHAENEGTGVVISNLDSGYYKDHYAGARRLV
jgi:cell wall-associated NlpC family hydrolase